MKFLKTNGMDIITNDGEKIILKGYGLGGWMNMEHFINGYPFVESEFRRYMIKELGEERGNLFFDEMLDNYLREEDIKFMKEVGFNSIRVPINYRHFEDDNSPFIYKKAGFDRFSRLITLAKKYELYLIIDLHAAQGCQNEDWHSDNKTGKALLWEHKLFQERTISLWEEIARRYKNESTIAGYEIINEPVAEDIESLNTFYRDSVKAIRKIDKKHIIFLEGNIWGHEFKDLDKPFDSNLVYVNHFYVQPFVAVKKYPDKKFNINNIRKIYSEFKEWSVKYSVPMWSGEFGILYSNDKVKDDMAARILDDQLTVVEENGDSWNLWTYKDIGIMGLLKVRDSSKYMKEIKKFDKFKEFVKSDSWLRKGTLFKSIGGIIEKYLTKKLQSKEVDKIMEILHRRMPVLFSEIMLPYYVKMFKKMNSRDISEMMKSWRLENCNVREEVVRVLKKHCKTE